MDSEFKFDYLSVSDNLSDMKLRNKPQYETKANRDFINERVSASLRYSAGVLPTVFELPTDVHERDVSGNLFSSTKIIKSFVKDKYFYSVDVSLAEIFPLLTRPALLLIGFIGVKMDYGANCVVIEEKAFCEYSGFKKNSFYSGVENLKKFRVIHTTDKQSLYIVNHNYLFKGNLYDFLLIHRSKFKEAATLDEKGRIIIKD